MRLRSKSVAALGVVAVFAALTAARTGVSAQGAAALTGVVSSQAEGKMEGVVVTARRDGANFDVSVVSDAQGKYTFPRTHLAPGDYALTIRAVGFDLPAAKATVAAGRTANMDLALQKVADMSRQLTSVEWAMNLPGSEADKDKVLKQAASCAYCHNIERIVRSKYTAEQFPAVISRMQKYYLDGTVYSFEGRGRAVLETKEAQERAEKNPNWGYWPDLPKAELGAYLATINMQGFGKNLPSTFKTLPRPKGAETRVIITQYDIPRKDTVAHDGDISKDGSAFWYSDQSALFIGRLDTRTGTFKEWAAPPTSKKPAGVSDVVTDPDGYVWLPVTSDLLPSNFGIITRFDPRTETFETTKKMPPDAHTQFLSLDGRGNLWTGFFGFFRIDRKTNTVEEFTPMPDASKRPPGRHGNYQMEVDSKGNPVICDFMGGYVIKMNGATKEFKWIKVPTVDGMPRRGRMDKDDRFWFSLYRGDKIGMLDMKTDTVKEYPMPFQYFTPYTASVPDSRGRVFASSNTSDRLARLDTKTGATIMYLMPTRDFDTKKIAIDPRDGKTVWFANKRSARVVKLEQLD